MDQQLEETLLYYNVNDVVELLAVNGLIVEDTERSGEELLCLCQFHNDSKPSMRVHRDSGLWHCVACQVRGNIVQLIAKLNNTSPGDIYNRIRNRQRTYDVSILQRNLDDIEDKQTWGQSENYAKVYMGVVQNVNAHLAELGQTVSGIFRATSPNQDIEDPFQYVPRCRYDLCDAFDEFAGTADEVLTYFNFYRPPQWTQPITNLLKFYHEFLQQKTVAEQRIVNLLTETV